MFYGQTEILISYILHVYSPPEFEEYFLGLQMSFLGWVGARRAAGGAINIDSMPSSLSQTRTMVRSGKISIFYLLSSVIFPFKKYLI